jgi:glycosyltransferase involved in cell wall biosynthesis
MQKETSTATGVLSGPVRVHVVDPSAYTPPYDHALCAALARAGLDVELFTSRFRYAEVPAPDGYTRHELFYRHAPARGRRAAKLAEHIPDMLRYRRRSAQADVVHFQWLTLPQVDQALLPRGCPLVLTAHEPLAREATPGQRQAQRRLYRRFDAVIAHSQAAARRIVADFGLKAEIVATIPHGAFTHLAATPPEPLPAELAAGHGPVVLCLGLIRPYKGIDVLLDAWSGIDGAQLWIVGRPRFDIASLRASAPPGVSWLPRFVSDGELAACFRRADLAVLPYREGEQSGIVATALAFGTPLLLTDVGGFGEVAQAGAARLVAPGDPAALREGLIELLGDEGARRRLSEGARALAAGEWSWTRVAERTAALYRALLS